MHLTVYLIIFPLLIAFIIGIMNCFTKKYLKPVILTGTFIHLILIIMVIIQARQQPLIYSPGDRGLLGIQLMVDHLAAMMLAVIGLLVPLVIIYSLIYVTENISKFYTLIFIMTAGVTGMVITADLFNLFVFLEITSISSYALAAIPKKDSSIEGAFKYMILGTLSGIFILLAIILIYATTGYLNMAQIARTFSEIPLTIRHAIITFFVFGFTLKFALIPLHTWLPDIYSGAAVPYNVLSSGMVIKASIIALIRILYTFIGSNHLAEMGITIIMIYWGVVTFLIAHTTAFQQTDIKRMLAYSSIAQMGYVTIGLFLGTKAGLIGGGYHLINHAIMKGALFFTAGIFIIYTGSSRLKDYRGLGYKLPLISIIFVIAAFAIIGLPPFNGFISKWLIIEAALEADHVAAAFFIPVGSLLSLTYYLKIIRNLYSPLDNEQQAVTLSWKLKMPTIILGGLCILLGLFPALPLRLLNNISHYLLENSNYVNLFIH